MNDPGLEKALQKTLRARVLTLWLESQAGRACLDRQQLAEHMSEATHLLWTTGGSLVPAGEYERFHAVV